MHDAPVQVAWRLLGPETVQVDGVPVPLSNRCRGLLVRLLAEPNRAVSTDRLSEFIWGDCLPKNPRNVVARFVSDLRTALGPLGERVISSGGYRISVSPGELDVELAALALAEARSFREIDGKLALEAASKGLALVGTEPNSLLVDLPNAAPIMQQHDALRIDLISLFLELQLSARNYAEVLQVAQQSIESYPYQEAFHLQLMMALHRSGRSTHALRVGQRLRELLKEVGMVPGPTARQLEYEIVRGHDPETSDFLSWTRPGESHGKYPVLDPGTTIIGRNDDLSRLDDQLNRHRLVTVVGVQGIGKSRLALAALRRRMLLGDRVYRISLSRLSDPAMLPSIIAGEVGVPSDLIVRDPESLARSLRNVEAVVLLDGCQNIAVECRELLQTVLDGTDRIRFVLTSKTPLGLDDEVVFRLGMLSLPERGDTTSESSAVRLFLDRARPFLPSNGVDEADLNRVSEICHKLGGLPAAIEIAAAQLARLSLSEVARRTAAARLDPNNGEASVAALADALEATWNALVPTEQILMSRLSVFVGGWSAHAAKALAPQDFPVEDCLASLVASGLISQTKSTLVETTAKGDPEEQNGWGAGPPGVMRYSMIDVVREFAAGRLDERRETGFARNRLVEWVKSLMQPWEIAELHSWAHAGEGMLEEQGNLTVALTYLQESHRLEDLVWLAVDASGSWINHGGADQIVRWLAPMVGDPNISDEARSAAAAMLMEAAHATGDLTLLTEFGMKSLELAQGRPHNWIPSVAGFLGMWSMLFPVPLPMNELFETARSAAENGSSRETNLGLVEMYRAHAEFGSMRYDVAADRFRAVQALCPHPGRLLLFGEVGEALSLLLAGKLDDAVAAVETWKSRADTDDWHYIVSVVRSIIRGSAGHALDATVELAADVRRLQPASIWGRADDFQTAFGILALQRGERDLAVELLATPLTRYLLLAPLVVKCVAELRGVDDPLGVLSIAGELWARNFPNVVNRGNAKTTEGLVAWWTQGMMALEQS